MRERLSDPNADRGWRENVDNRMGFRPGSERMRKDVPAFGFVDCEATKEGTRICACSHGTIHLIRARVDMVGLDEMHYRA